MIKILCPICDSLTASEFLMREQVPVHQHLVVDVQQDAANVSRGDLRLCVCEACGFVFNSAFDQSRLMYGEKYDNAQFHSPFFQNYLEELVIHMVIERGVRRARIVEVGSGEGLFLRKLVEFEGAENTGCGFDPSFAGDESDFNDRLRFEKRYYDEECAQTQADVVVSRHVIEHVPDPVAFLRNIRKALANSPEARLFIETPCVSWILRRCVIWDFFYEHCSYFNAQSLTTALVAAGFEVDEVRYIFEGQYLWVESHISHDGPRPSRSPGDLPQVAHEFARHENQLFRDWISEIKSLRNKGGVALFGAGAKGVTFANLIDPKREWIECLVDLNPAKQGRFVPGTGHPIVSHKEVGNYGVQNGILLNPNYRAENQALLRQAGLNIGLV